MDTNEIYKWGTLRKEKEINSRVGANVGLGFVVGLKCLGEEMRTRLAPVSKLSRSACCRFSKRQHDNEVTEIQASTSK